MAADFIVLALVFSVAYYARTQLDHRALLHTVYAKEYLASFLAVAPIWILIFASLGLYSSQIYTRRLVEWSRIALGSLIGVLLIIGWEYTTGGHFFPARLVAWYVLIGSALSIILAREVLRFVQHQLFRYGRGVSRVLIIGNSAATADIMEALASTHKSGYQIVAFAGPAKLLPAHLGIVHYSRVEEALKNIKKHHITTIIQTDLYDSEDRNQKILGAAQVNHIQYNFIPGEPGFTLVKTL
jgi:FlaA1/EpsC-like NDP-sugar epimerase